MRILEAQFKLRYFNSVNYFKYCDSYLETKWKYKFKKYKNKNKIAKDFYKTENTVTGRVFCRSDSVRNGKIAEK